MLFWFWGLFGWRNCDFFEVVWVWLLGFVAVWRGFGGGSVLGRGGNWGGFLGILWGVWYEGVKREFME